MSSGLHHIPLLVNGEFIQSRSKIWRNIANQYLQNHRATVPSATNSEVRSAVKAAKAAFPVWSRSSEAHRGRIVASFCALARQHSNELSQFLAGPYYGSVALAQQEIERGLNQLISLLLRSERRSQSRLKLYEHTNWTCSGSANSVCAGITSFQLPSSMPLWRFIFGIAQGNTFVVRHAEHVPLFSIRFAELAMEAGLPPGVLNVVHGGSGIADALSAHPDIGAIYFFGSTRAGARVRDRAITAGKHVSCVTGMELAELCGRSG